MRFSLAPMGVLLACLSVSAHDSFSRKIDGSPIVERYLDDRIEIDKGDYLFEDDRFESAYELEEHLWTRVFPMDAHDYFARRPEALGPYHFTLRLNLLVETLAKREELRGDEEIEDPLLAQIAALKARIRQLERSPDPHRFWKGLMGPSVQLAGTRTVGSGVIVAGPDPHTNYVLTSWHVVRDILADFDSPDQPIEVTLYAASETARNIRARLVFHEVDTDIALLRVNSTKIFHHVARLPSSTWLQENRHIFGEVMAVGCPLGNDPIPTNGHWADIHHIVEGDWYCMISAPTYVGNSGGGVFDPKTLNMMGIFSKIYTHGTLRPTVVPHMGLVTPLEVVYASLGRGGFRVSPAMGRSSGHIVKISQPIAKAQSQTTR